MSGRTVLVLGAGFVAGPLVRYLLERVETRVRVASLEGAEALVAGEPRGEAIPLDAADDEAVARLVADADLTVSLLPPPFHPRVARACLRHGRPMVTTSYAGEAMRALDEEARRRGVLLLNEVGVDPGLDHMTALRCLRHAREAGGRIDAFRSHCGGLPAPEANDNPFGYKFSWAPRGVLAAARRPARFLEEGRVVEVDGDDLFAHGRPLDLGADGVYESYPNADATAYAALYGLEEATTVYRGTLRYPGHCRAWKAYVELGLLDETERDVTGATWADLMRDLAGLEGGADVREGLARRLGMDADEDPVSRLAWLGLFDEDPLGVRRGAPLDLLAARMLERMGYAPGERDLVVMHHDIEASYPDRRERVTMTITATGEPGGDSAMARTVGLPAAVATRLVLEGAYARTGVRIPTEPAFYEPILDELETLGISGRERTERF